TTAIDWFIIILILTQATFGLYIAFWDAYYNPVIRNDGSAIYASSWFTTDIGSWLRSLLVFDPDTSKIGGMPWAYQFHFANGLFIIAVFPFTRLMHLLSYPFRYMWRSYQVVIFNRVPYTRDHHWDK
ncbi:MAG: respiratory nitrate reductase subunit gamma, partial [Candidatus Heimdallarchaeota archaeon]|nr:respiratory nitrate reductase subunit gamma [Candidatus Heimdallarchaeota archaeon]